MKILVQPVSKKNMYQLDDKDIDGFIIGLKNFSIFQNLKLDINEIKKLNLKKEVYISINKLIHNDELDLLKKYLIELSKLNIKGILFEDISIYNINNNLKLNLNLIWNQNHLPTNSYTCNYWKEKGCNGALLSTELMINDFIKIKRDTGMIIMVYIYGYIPIFESSRELITNYKLHIKNNNIDNFNYLYEKERNKFYPIYEENNNTFICEEILNGINYINELKKNNIDYIVLNGLLHTENSFNIIVDKYIYALKNNIIYNENNFSGFLFKESIYKVKE